MAGDWNEFSKPAPIDSEHDLRGFNCGEPVLDDWLRKRALGNMRLGATRTYVICPRDLASVAGCYSLCMGQVSASHAAGSMRRNMPAYIPSVMLARLAVDQTFQGYGLGRRLLADAVHRSLRASLEVSARLVIVHALSPAAEAFYRRHGFERLPIDTPTYALDLVKWAATGS